MAASSLVLAFARQGAPPEHLDYSTTWFGHTLGGGERRVQNFVEVEPRPEVGVKAARWISRTRYAPVSALMESIWCSSKKTPQPRLSFIAGNRRCKKPALQVASQLIEEGLVDEALAIVRAVIARRKSGFSSETGASARWNGKLALL